MVKTLTGYVFEIEVNEQTTIRALRSQMAFCLGGGWDSIIPILRLGNVSKRVYCEADPEMTVVQFLQEEFNESQITLESLTIYSVLNLGKGNYKYTVHNPDGGSVYYNLVEKKNPNFYDQIEYPLKKNGFLKRLQDINFPINQLPEKFFCKHSGDLLVNPHVAEDQKTYNLTYIQENGLRSVAHNLALRSELELFVAEEETFHLLARYKSSHYDNSLEKMHCKYLTENQKNAFLTRYIQVWKRTGGADKALIDLMASTLPLSSHICKLLQQNGVAFKGVIPLESLSSANALHYVELGGDINLSVLARWNGTLLQKNQLMQAYIEKLSARSNDILPKTIAPNSKVNGLIQLLSKDNTYAYNASLIDNLSQAEKVYLVHQLIKKMPPEQCYHHLYKLASRHHLVFAPDQGAIYDLLQKPFNGASWQIAKYLIEHGEVVDFNRVIIPSEHKVFLMKVQAKAIASSQRLPIDKINAIQALSQMMQQERRKNSWFAGITIKSDMTEMGSLLVSVITETLDKIESTFKSSRDVTLKVASYNSVLQAINQVKNNDIIKNNNLFYNVIFGYFERSFSSQLDALESAIKANINQLQPHTLMKAPPFFPPVTTVQVTANNLQIPQKPEQRFTTLANPYVQPVSNPYVNSPFSLYPTRSDTNSVSPPQKEVPQFTSLQTPIRAAVTQPAPAPVVKLEVPKTVEKKVEPKPPARPLGFFNNLSNVFWPTVPKAKPGQEEKSKRAEMV